LVTINALVATELSTSIDWPETGLEEINSDVLEADFWTRSSEPARKRENVTFGLPVVRGNLSDCQRQTSLKSISRYRFGLLP
jgi:hypothetical protein